MGVLNREYTASYLEVCRVAVLCVHDHTTGCVGLLELVVDSDEGLQGAGGGVLVKLLLFIVQGLGVGMALDGTVS